MAYRNFGYIINGVGGSGKDTFIKYVMDALNGRINTSTDDKSGQVDSEPISVINFSSIDLEKEILSVASAYYDQIRDSAEQKDDRYRSALSALKGYLNDAYNISEIVLQRKLDNHIKLLDEFSNVMMFIHCREPIEIDRTKTTLRNNGFAAVHTILVKGSVPIDAYTNSSDRSVMDYVYDYTIDNNGTLDDLKEKAVKFVDSFKDKYFPCE